MPMFIFISGYFSKKQQWVKFKQGIIKLLTILLVFEVINLVGQLVVYRSFIPFDRPYWTLWYILSLIYWRIFIQLTGERILRYKGLTSIISLLASIIIGLIPLGYTLSIQRTIVFLPFFLAGYYCRENGYEKVLSVKTYLLIPVLVAGYILTTYMTFNGMPVLEIIQGAHHYNQLDVTNLALIFYRMIFMLISASACIMFAKIINLSHPLISQEGSHSLFYYIYHGMLIDYFFYPIMRLLNIQPSLIFAFIVTALIIIILFYMRKIRLFNTILLQNK